MAAKLSKLGAMHTAGIFSDMTVDGPEIGTLVVIVDRAKNLPNRKAMGKQDPYCAARLGKEAKKTDTDKRGGQTPRWDKELRFTVHDSPDYNNLKVSVFNDDKKTELIGETWVSLVDILAPGGGQSDTWFSLNCRGKYAGEVRLELTFYDSRAKPEGVQVKESRRTRIGNESGPSTPSGRQNASVRRRPLPNNPIEPASSPSTAPNDSRRPLPSMAGPRQYGSPAATQSPQGRTQPRSNGATPVKHLRSSYMDSQPQSTPPLETPPYPESDMPPTIQNSYDESRFPRHNDEGSRYSDYRSQGFSSQPDPFLDDTEYLSQAYNNGPYQGASNGLPEIPPLNDSRNRFPRRPDAYNSVASREYGRPTQSLAHSYSAPAVPAQQQHPPPSAHGESSLNHTYSESVLGSHHAWGHSRQGSRRQSQDFSGGARRGSFPDPTQVVHQYNDRSQAGYAGESYPNRDIPLSHSRRGSYSYDQPAPLSPSGLYELDAPPPPPAHRSHGSTPVAFAPTHHQSNQTDAYAPLLSRLNGERRSSIDRRPLSRDFSHEQQALSQFGINQPQGVYENRAYSGAVSTCIEPSYHPGVNTYTNHRRRSSRGSRYSDPPAFIPFEEPGQSGANDLSPSGRRQSRGSISQFDMRDSYGAQPHPSEPQGPPQRQRSQRRSMYDLRSTPAALSNRLTRKNPEQTPITAAQTSPIRQTPPVGTPYSTSSAPYQQSPSNITPQRHPLAQQSSAFTNRSPYAFTPPVDFDAAPIIKPQPVSPLPISPTAAPATDPRVPRPTSRHVPARKSISPRPPEGSAERRLSAVPFSPDSFDEFNPNAPGSRRNSSTAQSPTTNGPNRIFSKNGTEQIIDFHGNAIDPSDRLPEHSWAPEPEPKGTPKEKITRERERLTGARSTPQNAASEAAALGGRGSTFETNALENPVATAATARAKLQKKEKSRPQSMFLPSRIESSYQPIRDVPFPTSPGYNGPTSPSSGGFNASSNTENTYARRRSYVPPPIPAKVPLNDDFAPGPLVKASTTGTYGFGFSSRQDGESSPTQVTGGRGFGGSDSLAAEMQKIQLGPVKSAGITAAGVGEKPGRMRKIFARLN